MKQILFTLIIFCGFPALADRPWTMDSGTTISVDSWDPITRTYELTYLEQPGQGPLITTQKELARCIKAINLGRIIRDPTSVLSAQYTTDRDLVLLLPEQVEARKT